MSPLVPNPEETARRSEVVAALLSAIARSETIKLPAFDPEVSHPGAFSMASVGLEANAFGGFVGEYRYQFEGEEDLLHLMVVRQDEGQVTPAEGQAVAAFVLDGVPPLLVWFRPGAHSAHFFVGHDVLPGRLRP